MKRLLIILPLIYLISLAVGQEIVYCEYFVDTDPGFGNGITVQITSPSNDLDLSFTPDLADMNSGFHYCGIRSKNSNGDWSVTQVFPFYLVPYVLADESLIFKVEYFIDHDPGFGKATPIQGIVSSGEIALNFSEPVQMLPAGFHSINIRAFDKRERWSVLHSGMFYKVRDESSGVTGEIKQLEYFIDEDPGFGKAEQIPVGEVGAEKVLDFSPLIKRMSPGFHSLNIRSRDTKGAWSVLHAGMYYKVRDNMAGESSGIDQIEYFIDTDPGYGNGEQIPSGMVEREKALAFSSIVEKLSSGFHFFNIRAKDESGSWSVLNNIMFYKILNQGALTQNKIVSGEYFFDEDPGFGNGKKISISNPGFELNEIFNADLSNVNSGIHNLYVRVKDASNHWSHLMSSTFLYNTVSLNNTVLPLFNIYPNPSKGQIKISMGEQTKYPITIKIQNMEGIVLFNKQLKSEKVIHTDLPAGIYMITIRSRKDKCSSRIIIF